jgi:hypothetical protein
MEYDGRVAGIGASAGKEGGGSRADPSSPMPEAAWVEIMRLYIEAGYGSLATQLICCIVGLKSMP